MEELYINRLKFLLLAFIIFTLGSFTGAAATYTVATDGTGNYATIQDAVNNAASGDIVVVKPGIYTENVYINKTTLDNFTLMSASENLQDTKISAKDASKHVITVDYRNNIVIKGFTISGATGTNTAGINLLGSRYCTVEKNLLIDNTLGVSLSTAVNNVIRENTITRTNGIGNRGVSADRSTNATITGNSISNNTYGVYLSNSGSSNLAGNTISDSSRHGIVLESTNSATVDNNTVKSSGDFGIYLTQSSNDSVINNVVSKSNNGINLVSASRNTIYNNAADSATHAIFMNVSNNNNLTSNTVSNSHYGIAMRYSNNNNITGNNAFNNNIALGDAGFYFTWTSNGNKISGNKANSNFNGFVLVNDANNNILENNEVTSNANFGIYIENAPNNQISGNKVSQNVVRGISLLGVSTKENTISANIVNSNYGNGIYLENTSNNHIKSNSLDSNTGVGINLVYSNNSNVDNNTVINSNDKGILITGSSGDRVFNNTASYNIKEGIMLSLADSNTVSKNTASNNNQGISLNSSVNNNVSSNTLEWNGLNGMYLCPRSVNNLIYDNNFYNVINANVKNPSCTWNIAKTTGTGRNIMGGPSLGGNFWAKPDYTGHSQVTPDKDNDGFVDSPYIEENIVDNYPLIDFPDPVVPVASFSANPMSGYVPLSVQFTDTSQNAVSWNWNFGDGNSSTEQNPKHTYSVVGNYTATLTATNENGTVSATQLITVQKILPIANFNANPISGYAPLSVQFTDLSQYATSRNWDIGNDGTVESTDASFVYVFNNPGIYPVSLTAKNENGTSSSGTITITVTEESSSSNGGSHSGGGGGGGGGAGGSPEPQTNVQVKELSKAQVSNGKPVKFDFTKNATCVVYVSFDAKKTASKITTIAEQLKAKSTLVSVLDSGEVYKYFNLWVGNSGFATEKNIENPVVCFKVEKSWMQNKKMDQNSITLNRYNDKKWSQLPVKCLKEDDKYLYFTAETPGFSFFAITGKAVEKETVAETKPSTDTSKLEKNNTASETKTEQKPKQETGKDKATSIPGFEALYVVACLVMVFLHRRK